MKVGDQCSEGTIPPLLHLWLLDIPPSKFYSLAWGRFAKVCFKDGETLCCVDRMNCGAPYNLDYCQIDEVWYNQAKKDSCETSGGKLESGNYGFVLFLFPNI